MICDPCKTGQHDDCTLGDCDCPERKVQEEVEKRLRAIRGTDERLATKVCSTLLYGGSECARQLAEQNGRDAICLFTAQIIATIRAMNC
ncbi:MAG: hypothetical protein LC114_05860 [Bryobacterales bacterium]|nr:hypothetical protein [Bryobacterales bacterium]